jgi:hypothetical protein
VSFKASPPSPLRGWSGRLTGDRHVHRPGSIAMRERLFALIGALWILVALPMLLLAGMSARSGEGFHLARLRDAVDLLYFLLIAPPMVCARLWFGISRGPQ